MLLCFFPANPHPLKKIIKLVGGRISALPTRPVLNTVQFTSLPKLQGSYDCTLPLLPDTFPLEDTRIFSHSLEANRRQLQIVKLRKSVRAYSPLTGRVSHLLR